MPDRIRLNGAAGNRQARVTAPRAVDHRQVRPTEVPEGIGSKPASVTAVREAETLAVDQARAQAT